MSFMKKLMFWKKDDLGLDELKKDITNINTGVKEEAMSPEFQPQNPQVTNLGFKEANTQSMNNQNSGYNQNYGYQRSQNYAPQNYNRNEVIDKSLEVVSAKLDSIKIAIDNINQRLNNIEDRLKNKW